MIHYNARYFGWQKRSGEFGATADLFKFKDYIKSSDRVLEFGCGGAYLLARLNCAEKVGVEINSVAREQAAANGVTTVESAAAVPDNWADVVISHHALEHCLRPLDEILLLKDKLTPGGLAVFVLPFERRNSYKSDDIDQHLYTWSPQNIGNLFKTAGYEVVDVAMLKHRWPPYPTYVYRILGSVLFDLACKVYSRLRGDLFQVRIVARKP